MTPGTFLDPVALALVLGGTGLAALLRTPLRDLTCALAALGTLPRVRYRADDQIEQIAALSRIAQHCAAAEMWAAAAETAPAMGMVGTLVGLVRMFSVMNDPAAIGGAMAVALLATLYGAVLANLVLMPISQRLRARARAEAFERTRLAEPLIALARREAPRVSAAKLASVA